MMGLIDLGTVFGLSDPRWEWPVSLEASWGSLFTFLIAGAFGWIGTRPDRPWPGLILLGLVVAALLLSGLVLLDPGPVWVALGLAAPTVAIQRLLAPGQPPARQDARPGAIWAGAVGAGVPLWLGYAWFTYLPAAAGVGGDITNGVDHWPVQIALGLVLSAGAGLLSAWRSDLLLWRVGFALTAAIVAYGSLVYPERAGAMPHWLWGVAIAGWGVAVVLPIGRKARR